jgi:hypothetical protein
MRQADAGGEELKKVMKATVESEYVVCQKLAYEKRLQKDLKVSLMVALQSLQNDQVTIVGLEVEVNDLKNAADHVMDMVESQVAVGIC